MQIPLGIATPVQGLSIVNATMKLAALLPLATSGLLAGAPVRGIPSLLGLQTGSTSAVDDLLVQNASSSMVTGGYDTQEQDLSDPSHGVWSLGTAKSHARSLPLEYQNASEGAFPSYGPHGRTFKDRSLKWHLRNTNGSVQVPALFPSLAHLDLMAAGVISDPNGK